MDESILRPKHFLDHRAERDLEERINLTSTKYSSPANNHMEESSIVYLTVIVSVDKLSSDYVHQTTEV